MPKKWETNQNQRVLFILLHVFPHAFIQNRKVSDDIAINVGQLLMNLWCRALPWCTKWHPWSHFRVTELAQSRYFHLAQNFRLMKWTFKIQMKHAKSYHPHKNVSCVAILTMFPPELERKLKAKRQRFLKKKKKGCKKLKTWWKKSNTCRKSYIFIAFIPLFFNFLKIESSRKER